MTQQEEPDRTSSIRMPGKTCSMRECASHVRAPCSVTSPRSPTSFRPLSLSPVSLKEGLLPAKPASPPAKQPATKAPPPVFAAASSNLMPCTCSKRRLWLYKVVSNEDQGGLLSQAAASEGTQFCGGVFRLLDACRVMFDSGVSPAGNPDQDFVC